MLLYTGIVYTGMSGYSNRQCLLAGQLCHQRDRNGFPSAITVKDVCTTTGIICVLSEYLIIFHLQVLFFFRYCMQSLILHQHKYLSAILNKL